jgi:hypothetical protein
MNKCGIKRIVTNSHVQNGRKMPSTQPQRRKRELNTARFTLALTPSLLEKLTTFAAESPEFEGNVSAVVKKGIESVIEGKTSTHPADAGLGDFRAKFLTKAPAGPWREAVEHAGEFVLSQDVADELEARDGDVVVRVMGESMEGAGIPDGALLLMRPLNEGRQPLPDEIALVQAIGESGEYWSTIKHWCVPRAAKNFPQLKDGDKSDYDWPPGTVEVVPVAVARGIIGRIGRF